MKDNIELEKLEIYEFHSSKNREIPLAAERIQAGFPSPAENYIDGKLDLNEHLIAHPAATFYVRAAGDSMINAGIKQGDLLIVDKSLQAKNNDIVVAVLDGEFTLKRLIIEEEKCFLKPENDKYKIIEINENSNFVVWGVVTYVISKTL